MNKWQLSDYVGKTIWCQSPPGFAKVLTDFYEDEYGREVFDIENKNGEVETVSVDFLYDFSVL